MARYKGYPNFNVFLSYLYYAFCACPTAIADKRAENRILIVKTVQAEMPK